jgi:drug/metabolite transporter (DMT)-like permease
MSYSLVEPLVAVGGAAIVLGERLTLLQMVGAATILLGLALNSVAGRFPPVVPRATPELLP